MAKHKSKFKELMRNSNLDGLLIKSKSSKKYLDTLTGSGVQVLLTKEKDFLILDGRYVEEAKIREKDFEIIENTQAKSGKSHFDVLKEIFDFYGYESLGIEENAYSIKDYEDLKKYNLKMFLIGDEINKARIIKDEEEIEIIKEACEITDKIFTETLKHIKVGVSENEVNAWIHYYALKMGASKMAFEPVITSGERTALPHGRPSNRKIKLNEPIMIDFGIEYKNYQSDMTRTIFMGQPSEEMKKIYELVKEAQAIGIEAIKSGKKAKDIDYIVREKIKENGYGDNFNHGLGHGIGIGDGCEYPFLNEKSETVLEEGMIMSCEPGIYVAGLGGVRIEDDILIKDGVGIALNKTKKDMIILEG